MPLILKKFDDGLIFDSRLSMYPTIMHGVEATTRDFHDISSTFFGYVMSGNLTVRRHGLPAMELAQDMYFSSPGPFTCESSGRTVIIERIGYRGLFTAGGPIEESGRLCYIDNCSTTQLIPPQRLGDPTLQLLVFPPHCDQSLHLHPTLRMGFIQSGSGYCKTSDGKKLALEKGQLFCIPERLIHGFQSGPEKLFVLAFHPDSDVGPTDQIHPMISRTYLQR